MQPAGRPEVDAVWGIPPTVAIEQRPHAAAARAPWPPPPRSGTLRLLYVKLGVQRCVHDGAPCGRRARVHRRAADARLQRPAHRPARAPWSSTARASTPTSPSGPRAVATHLRVDGEFRHCQLPAHRPLQGTRWSCRWATSSSRRKAEPQLRELLLAKALDLGRACAPAGATDGLKLGRRQHRRGRPALGSSPPSAPARSAAPATRAGPRLFSYNLQGWWPLRGRVALTREQRKQLDDSVQGDDNRGAASSPPGREAEVEGLADAPCPECHGTRLTPPRAASNSTARPSAPSPAGACARRASGSVEADRRGRDADIARDVVSEICGRLEFLGRSRPRLPDAGPRRTHARAARRSASVWPRSWGSNLQGVCYVLDEPTIGLHPRDNQILLKALATLGDKGNTGRRCRARRRHHPPRRPF